MKLTGENRSTRGKTCPSATNPTWTDPVSNPGFRGERPATNRLSYGTALLSGITWRLPTPSFIPVRQQLRRVRLEENMFTHVSEV
jgi:hypothetical protein